MGLGGCGNAHFRRFRGFGRAGWVLDGLKRVWERPLWTISAAGIGSADAPGASKDDIVA